MIIPWKNISADALEGIIEEFIMREGTDYGEHEVSFTDKKEQVLNQLKLGEIVLVFSELHETVNLMPAATFNHDENHAE
ncbi:YheU family protein [Psychrosphaera haliotis]|uniref:YheU family protein n=1 Tax=Psychrosphaera haliotis TaxID=555083 RepID=A0A6N8FAS7_9GAMM|nr:YheU family protein [Psychrosphaera haliotis]MUH73418.1 YheU family protein [Psychrosphaera haliotis]